MSKLQLILLGHFDCLLSSGERISFSMRKAEVLLAYLALAPGIRHPRERLINLLWSDRSEEQARNSLRQCLSAIRKSFGNAADLIMQVDRTTVSLKLELVDVDALDFERLAATADFESLSDAAALYQGEFLEGISIRDAAGQDWLEGARTRFKRQYIEILTNLGHTLLASRDYSAAVKSGEHLVEQDPLGEPGWRLLIRSYFEHGDRSHALQAFKRCQQALRDELDVEPEAATVELRDQIAAGGASLSSAPTPGTKKSSVDTPPITVHNIVNPAFNSEVSTDHSIVVLPFDNLSGDPEQEYFSDGITESIILNLSLFPGLQVKSRSSSFAFKQQIVSPGEISRELNVDYIVEGSVRKSNDRIRITVQLIEAASANQIWGKRYDARLEDLFDLEEDLSRTIAATVTGQIESDLQRIALAKGAAHQESYDLLLGGMYHLHRFTGPDIAIALDKFIRCLEFDPDNVLAHTGLYYCHSMNYMERWIQNFEPSFDLSGVHASKALALGPEHIKAQIAYAEHLIFSSEYDKAATHIAKAEAINPNDADVFAMKSLNLIAQGKYKLALEVAETGCRLDPFHPWCDWSLAEAQYFCGQYESSLETIAISKNPPGFIRIYNIASYIKLGKKDQARQALQEFLQAARFEMKAMPSNKEEWLSYTFSNANYLDPRVNEQLIECMMEAGLEELQESNIQKPVKVTDHSSSIAVLPFDNLSNDPDQEYFSDGITESIILNLSLFPGLRVKSRNSCFAFKQQIKSLGEISAELDVDYVVEGSLRKSNERIRITVQLIEATSGDQVWGKRYDAEIENLFNLEEELSRTIAATVTGQIESELQRIAIRKGAADQQAYNLLLSGAYHLQQNGRDNVAIAIEEFNHCLSKDPDNARVHANLFYCHDINVMDRWTEDFEQSRELATAHVRKAFLLEPDLGLVQVAYANYLIFNGQFDEADQQLKRAMDVNPNDTEAIAMRAVSLSTQGKAEAALDQAELALKLDPYHAWARWIKAESQFFCGQYQDCLDTIVDIGDAPGFIQIYNIAANVRLGRLDGAQEALGRFLQYSRGAMLAMPKSIEEWLQYYRDNAPFADPAVNDQIIDCLVQAGLED